MAKRQSNSTAQATPAKPSLREQTKPQGRVGASSFGGFMDSKPPAATYKTYREMRANPTLALARMAAQAPIKAADWSVEHDEDAPKEAVQLIEDYLTGDPLRLLVREMLRAHDNGWQPFEIVYAVEASRYVPAKFKALLPELTEVRVEKETGKFAGLKQGKVTLEPLESLAFTYDMEADDYYGRSRFENARASGLYTQWIDTMKRAGKYDAKISGVTPVVRYPANAQSQDAGGAMVENFELAQRLMENLGKGNGVAFPAELSAYVQDLIRSGATTDDLWSWSITFLEPKGSHGSSFIQKLRYLDSLLIRSYLAPERSALEGQFGTKAEAESHGDIVLAGGEETLKDIAITLNWHLVDKLLDLNFGPQYRGTVRLVPAPLIDEKRDLMRSVVEKLLTEPMTLAAMAEVLELEAMLDKAGVPRREGVKIDPSKFVPANPQLPPIRIDDEPPTKPTGDPANPPKSPDELETTQSTVLNGAQVSAATAIVVAVAAGEIPRDAGLGQLEVLFNLKPEQAERIMGSAGKGTPTTPNTNPLHDLEPSPVIEPQQQPMTAALLSILQRSNNRLRKLSAVQAN